MNLDNLRKINEDVLKCGACVLCKNKHHAPNLSGKNRYIMYTEHPYEQKPAFMKEFWELAGLFGLEEEYFLQVSTVQCSTGINKRLKRYIRPSEIHRAECKKWFYAYISELKPRKMIVFGNLAAEEFTGEFDGISKRHATIIRPKIGGHVIPTVLSLPPSALKGDAHSTEKIKQALKTFKEIP